MLIFLFKKKSKSIIVNDLTQIADFISKIDNFSENSLFDHKMEKVFATWSDVKGGKKNFWKIYRSKH
jgi:hypothetical protein